MSNMIIVFSQRHEILRIKPEGSQKERGGGVRAGDARKDGSQPVLYKNLSVCLEEDFIHQEYIRLTPAMEYMELLKI